MEPLRNTVTLPIEEDSQIPAARRSARDLAERIGLLQDAVARAELVVVELAGNILHHAGHGRLFLSATTAGDALQIIALDAGPGIPSVQHAMQDGFTTSTTPGLGLGAVERLARDFDLYTQVGKGTVLSAVIGEEQPGKLAAAPPGNPTTVLSTCLEGEQLNGDSWTLFTGPERVVYTLIDGLGHGFYASEAAALARSIAEKAFEDDPDLALSLLLERMHGPMRATRGAAITLVAVDSATVTCCGVGNVSATLHGPDGIDRTMVSNNGTLGHQMRKVQEFRYPYSPGTLLAMHSDGLTTRWRMSLYPGLQQKVPATIAGVLYRDAVRGRDDATILVSRLESSFGGDHE
jgi:anti-sigma regulatory factor (Ser/Thr protein kinase)